MQARGLMDISVQNFQRALAGWVDEAKTTGHWSTPTITRIAQGLLSALRDFGVLQGAVNKKIAPAYFPIESFAYRGLLPETAPTIRSEANRAVGLGAVLFAPREGVERFLFEAHQRDLLEYHVAGSVTRLTFPAETLEEYANVVAQRSHLHSSKTT